MEKLDLGHCTTNDEVCKLVSERMKEVSLDDLILKVRESFVFQEKATKAIYLGLSDNLNVFLYGPGGYGKSSLIKFILAVYKIPYSVIVGYKDMSPDALLGIPDMDKLLNKSEYEIKFENSCFCSPGILIAEEFTDIRPATAAALKDILTEKGYRTRDKKIESLIACVITASNNGPETIVDDDSKRAFYIERFPIKFEVTWKEHTDKAYFKLLTTVFPSKDNDKLFFLASLFYDNHLKYNNTISPRIATVITKVFLERGLEHLYSMDIDLTGIEEIKKRAGEVYLNTSMAKAFRKVSEIISSSGKSTLVNMLFTSYMLKKVEVKDSFVDMFEKYTTELDAKILVEIEKGPESLQKINNLLYHDKAS